MSIKTKISNKIIITLCFYVILLVSFVLIVSVLIYGRFLPLDFKFLQLELSKFLLGVGVVFLIAGFYVARVIGRNIAVPLQEIIKIIERVSQGELEKRVKIKNNEMQELVSAVNTMIDEVVKMKQGLEEQVKRVQELDKTKSEFISIAAHQLRTPLSAIKWTFKMMIDEDVGEITLEQKEFLKRGYITNERMISLVNDLLNVSRIEEGRFGYEFKPKAIEDIIETLLKAAYPLLEEKRINFVLNKPAKPLRKINADAEKLTLALENILNNAIKYTPPKGKISLLVEEKENQLTIIVTDSGVGVPKDQISKLFTKFFRGSNVIRLQTDGSGLGLFITKNVIEKHKGYITIQSEESRGTVVKIALPFLEQKVFSSEEKFEEFIKGF